MRLPNLVEHDTLHEVIYNLQIIIIQESPPPRIFNDHISIQVSQQSMSWIPLLNIKCHPDTQLFLCSLFSPVYCDDDHDDHDEHDVHRIMTQVCLERPIYPCRSLCLGVRQGCQGRMEAYGFPWSVLLNWSLDSIWYFYSSLVSISLWYMHVTWYLVLVLFDKERASGHSKSVTHNRCILYLFVSFSFSFRKVMFAFVFPQASNARLCQVPAGQRHVHHRPVGQAGQQQGRQQSR